MPQQHWSAVEFRCQEASQTVNQLTWRDNRTQASR